MEIWKDIENYEGIYQVSNLGNIKSLKFNKEKILKPTIDGASYYSVNLYKNGVQKNFSIHKLVAISFLNHIPCGFNLVINHKDFNRLNNKVDNLEIITNRENTNKKHIKSSSEYVGVYWCKDKNKWRSQINYNGKTKHLGYFINEIEAHFAYQNELNKKPHYN